MVTRRRFLAVCGATAAAAAIPGKEAKALPYNPHNLKVAELSELPVLIDELDVSRYVKPGAYIGDTRPVVPEYEYCRQTSLRCYYEYLALLDRTGLAPGYSVYYDRHTFLDTHGENVFLVQGHSNIPLEKLNEMWELAERAARYPLRPHVARSMHCVEHARKLVLKRGDA